MSLALAVAAVVALAPQPAVITTQDVAHWARSRQDDGQQRALRFLVRAAWAEGEARERGIVVTAERLDAALKDEVDSKGGRRAYRRFLHKHRLTRSDARAKLRLDLLNAAIEQQIAQPAAESVTERQIDAFVAEHPTQDAETRDVRLIVARTRAEARKARAELQRRGPTWRGVARRHATSGRARLYRGAERYEVPSAAFKARPRRLTGPVKIGAGRFAILRVIAITPAHPTPAPVQRARAWEILASEAQQRALDAFKAAFITKWRARTTCAPAFASHPDCGGAT